MALQCSCGRGPVEPGNDLCAMCREDYDRWERDRDRQYEAAAEREDAWWNEGDRGGDN